MIAQDYRAPASVSRLGKRALTAGGIGVIVMIVGAVISPAHFYRGYLIGYLLILGLSLGSLALLMLQHLTSGQWGLLIRRPCEAASRSLWVVLAAFIPIPFGLKYLYGAWLYAPKSGEGALSHFQQSYLTPRNFELRAVLYFAVWFLLVLTFNRWSRRQDVDRQDRRLRRNIKMLSGPGIILYVFALSFAVFDWGMSISPHWSSTIYGFIYVAGQLIASVALMILIVAMLSRTEPLGGIIQQRPFADLGKFLLTFIMLWAYFSFSQLLIYWSGNQPEEISYYRLRLNGEWGYVAVIVCIFHFFVPLFLLLSRDLKRDTSRLPKVAAWMLFMRCVDIFWTVRPDFTPSAWPTVWDFAAVIGLGGIWLWFFTRQLERMPLLPLGDPKLAEVLVHHGH